MYFSWLHVNPCVDQIQVSSLWYVWTRPKYAQSTTEATHNGRMLRVINLPGDPRSCTLGIAQVARSIQLNLAPFHYGVLHTRMLDGDARLGHAIPT